MHQTVGVSEFVKRQNKNSGKTYSKLSLEEISDYSESEVNKNNFTIGYRNGVIVVNSKEKKFVKNFICPLVKINNRSKLIARRVKRQKNEDYYIRIHAKNGNPLRTYKVEIILYHKDVLDETNDRSQNTDWEIVSFHAIPHNIDKLPMKPVTMMRNQLQLTGGTKGIYNSDEWANSVNFWQKYAILEKKS